MSAVADRIERSAPTCPVSIMSQGMLAFAVQAVSKWKRPQPRFAPSGWTGSRHDRQGTATDLIFRQSVVATVQSRFIGPAQDADQVSIGSGSDDSSGRCEELFDVPHLGHSEAGAVAVARNEAAAPTMAARREPLRQRRITEAVPPSPSEQRHRCQHSCRELKNRRGRDVVENVCRGRTTEVGELKG